MTDVRITGAVLLAGIVAALFLVWWNDRDTWR